MKRIGLRWTSPLILVSAIGCSQDDGIKLVPVVGTVTRSGKPVADASLSFVPEPTNKQNTLGTAATGPSGNYTVVSLKNQQPI
jgi:hypothetical protein